MNDATRLTAMTEELDNSFDVLADYTYRVSEIRDEIRITEGEISQIILDVNGLTSKAAVDLEDFIEWERKLENRLIDCRGLARRIFRTSEFSYKLPIMIRDCAKMDLISIWMIGEILQVAHVLIDYFLILIGDYRDTEPQAPAMLELHMEMADEGEEVCDTPEAAKETATNRLMEKFSRLHKMANEIEEEIMVEKRRLLP